MSLVVKDGNGSLQTVPTPPAPGTAGTPSADVMSVQGVTSMTPLKVDGSGVTQPVSGTFWQVTQPVSGVGSFAITAASLPLPTGAATSAKQAALGIAGTASADVLTVQGIASMTALKVDGSAVTQPVSGVGSFAITAAALPLPTGAATSANQSTLNTNIGSSADAVVANGVAGSIASYLRTIKDQATSTASSAVTIDQTTPGTTDAVTIKSPADVISFTPTLDTAAYAAGDVLFATAAISGVTRANDLRSALMSLTAIDKSKNKPAFTLFFFQTNVTSAAANAANTLSDADAVNCLGYIRFASTDWIDLANNSFACFKGINLLLEAASGTTTVYVVGILDAGTPTFAVGDLVLKLGVVQS